ncbi:hypothetical protein ACFV3F_28735 [Streptomyces sp. NPDC059717]|uniref:hypothetical protein n=1 Tax=Streptomyces sp. NPDC059717 TaxID=3346922 RepID=UPI0036CE50B2
MTIRIVRKWGLVVAALAAAVSVMFTTVGAYAASSALPNEESQTYNEQAGGQNVRGRGAAEAYDTNGNHMTVWRGYDNNGIWSSINNQPAVELVPGSHTATQPWITSAGGNGWWVFHTGSGGQIYVLRAYADGTHSGWTAISGTTTEDLLPGSASAGPEGSFMIAWHGRGNNNISARFYNGYAFGGIYTFGNAQSMYPPAVAYNWQSSRYVIAHVGSDNQVYTAWQAYGYGVWNGWYNHGGSARSQPALAALHNGNMELAILGADLVTWSQELNNYGVGYGDGMGWSRETSGTGTFFPPYLVENRPNGAASTIFLLLTVWDTYNIVYKRNMFEGP